jgi:ABC-2 type transport system permease protein
MNKIWAIVRKEWREVFRRKIVLFSVAFLPLLLSTLPIMGLYGIQGASDLSEMEDLGNMVVFAEELCVGLSELECGQMLLLQQFMVLFLMIPVMIPVTIASYSIVGEKAGRTLEPLLATPISTTQLLVGKSLAAVIPAVAATLLGFSIFATGTAIIASKAVLAQFISPHWLIGILVVGPLLSVAAVSMAVMISSRVNDPRVAEQLSALVMLPVFAIFFGQLLGAILLNLQLMLIIAAVLLVVDAILLFFATQLFQRETILTRWK